MVPSPPPATLDIRVLQTNPPLLIGAGNDWCSNDITLVTMPVPLKFEVDVSGLDPEGAQEHRIRAGQFFLQYTSESCAGGSSAFDFTAVEAGQPDPPNPNLSPFQEELGWELVLPNIAGGTPGELRYGVGIPLLPTLVPMTACNNALATFTFTATAQGRLIVWFRDPAILPQSLLSDDSGGEIRPPPQGSLVLTQPDPADAVTITVDWTPPTATAPPGATVKCVGDIPAAATTYTAFVALGGTASDNCAASADLVITSIDGSLAGSCPSSLTRTYTITDTCGNSVDVNQTINVNDTTPPTATAPPGAAAQCADTLPAAATTYAEFAALGGSAADNCTATANLAVTSFDGPLVGGPCGGTVTRMYTLTDECLNSVSVGQIITVNDTTPPTGTAPPGASVQCVGDVPAAATTYAGLVALGGTASDNCTLNTNLSITSADGALAGACPSSFTRRYTIADECGNTVDVDQIITVNDTTLPVVGCGGGITQPADAGGCDAAVSWPAATATDNCDGDLSGSVVYEIDLDNNGSVDATQMATTFTFPGGTHLVTATATDTCSNTGSCSFTVTITPFNELVVSLELSPTIATGTSPDTLTRCITFELFNCAGGSVAMSQAIDFAVQTGLPTIGTTTLLVPCGTYDCVAIRDELHTLRRTDDDQFGVSPIVGTQYVADFTNRTASSGDDDSLISGNLNDDCWIDVVDFGLLAGVWGTFPSANTGCPITFPPAHADFSGNGQVWTEDFTFILLNMWRFSETNCCNAPPACGGTSGPGGGPIERISVQNLVQIGMMTAAAGDLNEDGWLDVQDIVLWMQGVRPTPRPDPPPPVLQKKWSPSAKEGARVGPQLGGNMEPLPRSSTGEGDEDGNGPRTGDRSAPSPDATRGAFRPQQSVIPGLDLGVRQGLCLDRAIPGASGETGRFRPRPGG